MFYVDKNLCTGCGLCVDACGQGAISLAGSAASIDETRCTSCGRCANLCLTGAIVTLETDAEQTPFLPQGAPVISARLRGGGPGASSTIGARRGTGSGRGRGLHGGRGSGRGSRAR